MDSIDARAGGPQRRRLAVSGGDGGGPLLAGEHELCRLEGWSHNAAHAEVPEDYWEAVLKFVLRKGGGMLTAPPPFDTL